MHKPPLPNFLWFLERILTDCCVFDRATASCDVHTDSLVQQVIREVFVGCTVLTIAHRIHTIADSDKIMVLSEGRVAEYGAPSDMLQQNGSMYRSLVEESATGSGGTPRASAMASS